MMNTSTFHCCLVAMERASLRTFRPFLPWCKIVLGENLAEPNVGQLTRIEAPERLPDFVMARQPSRGSDSRP